MHVLVQIVNGNGTVKFIDNRGLNHEYIFTKHVKLHSKNILNNHAGKQWKPDFMPYNWFFFRMQEKLK